MKPVFDQASLEEIRAAQAADPSALAETRDGDWVLKVKRDRMDIGVPAGTELVVRPQATAEAGEMVVVKIGADHVLRRYPDDVPLTGVVVGVVVEGPSRA